MPENVAGLQTIDWLRLTDRSFAEWALRPPPNTKVVIVLEESMQTTPRTLLVPSCLALVAVAGCG
jgi:hypothetical protein